MVLKIVNTLADDLHMSGKDCSYIYCSIVRAFKINYLVGVLILKLYSKNRVVLVKNVIEPIK